MFKKALVAAAVSLATTAATAAAIKFDVNGAAPGGVINVSNFVWQAGNALVVGALSSAPVDVTGDGIPDGIAVKTVAQARLASFTLTNGAPQSIAFPGEITYQATVYELVTGIGGESVSFALDPRFTSTFQLFYDNNAATFGNDQTGANYGLDAGAVEILAGTITSVSGTVTDKTTTGNNLAAILAGLGIPYVNPDPIAPLDCDRVGSGCVGPGPIDNAPGTNTHVLQGNNQFIVDVTSTTPNAFFKSDVDSLAIDLIQNVGISSPFAQGNPWVEIVGETPFYSRVGTTGRVNGAACTNGGQSQAGVNSARCDLLLQTTGVTTFNTAVVPEPGSIALVGLALAGLGFASRRKAARK